MADTDPAPRGPQPQATVQKRLAWFAEGWKGWDYEETLNAVIAASDAGWTDTQTYRETFKLLLVEDSAPRDLLLLARQPGKRELRPGEGLPRREDAVALVAEYRAKVAAQAAEPARNADDPEGDEAA